MCDTCSGRPPPCGGSVGAGGGDVWANFGRAGADVGTGGNLGAITNGAADVGAGQRGAIALKMDAQGRPFSVVTREDSKVSPSEQDSDCAMPESSPDVVDAVSESLQPCLGTIGLMRGVEAQPNTRLCDVRSSRLARDSGKQTALALCSSAAMGDAPRAAIWIAIIEAGC